MRWLMVMLIGLVACPSTGWAFPECFERATGKWLSGGCSSCRPGICAQNWVTDNPQFGYTAEQIEEREVTAAQVKALIEARHAPARAAKEAARLEKETAIKTKLGLSDTDMANLKAALKD